MPPRSALLPPYRSALVPPYRLALLPRSGAFPSLAALRPASWRLPSAIPVVGASAATRTAANARAAGDANAVQVTRHVNRLIRTEGSGRLLDFTASPGVRFP